MDYSIIGGVVAQLVINRSLVQILLGAKAA